MTEITKDMKSMRAAMLLSIWLKNTRKIVSVTYEDHKLLLYTLQPIRVVIQKLEEDQEPKFLFVIHDKKRATTHLEKEYGLHNVCAVR